MIGAYQLTVVGRIQNLTGMSALLLPLADLQDDTGRQLVVKVIDMTHIRLKILQNQADLFPGFCGINGFNRIKQLRNLRAAVKIHIGGIGIHTIPDDPVRMLHAEILDFMAQLLQRLAQFENIGFRSAVGMQKLIHHQNLH